MVMAEKTEGHVRSGTWRLPDSLVLEQEDDVAILRLSRPEKRNAISDDIINALERFFTSPPAWARVVLLTGDGAHFCAGLDLGELSEGDVWAGIEHSTMWHRAFARIEESGLPVVAALQGAVVGGGLELAATAHVRVAERSTFYALPEAQHGLFVGGGGSVRIPRLVGTQRMSVMMLTGRVLDAEEGQRIGLSDYLVEDGDAGATALALAHKIAANSSMTNFGVLQVLPRIAESSRAEGYVLESLMAAIASGSPEAKARMRAFLEGRAGKVRQP
jgi:enoyl-CoA hydratase/carnithine racemase